MKLLVPAIAAGTIAVGGGAAYYFLKVQPAQDVANPLSSFAILPKDTIAAGYLSLNDNTWDKASKFGTQEARDMLMQQLETIKSSVETDTISGKPLDYDKDIKPWLGSITVAGVTEKEGDEPAMVMIMGIKDKLEALKFATRQKDDAGDKAKITKYKGIDIYEFDDSTRAFLTLLDNHIVFSDKKSQVEAAIDIEKGADSVLSNAEIKDALNESVTVSNPVAVGFANPAILFEVASDLAPDTSAESQILLEDLKKYQALSLAWGIEDRGFRFKNVLKHSLDQDFTFDPLPGKVVSRFPENTLALIHSGYLDKTWKLASEQLERDPETKKGLDEFLQQFSQATQLDFEEDILSWMDGEFALGILPANDGILSQVGFGGAIAIKTSHQSTAKTTLDKLTTLVGNSGAQISKKDISGIPMTQWGIPVQPALVNYGWIDNKTLLMTLGESTVSTLTQPSAETVKQNSVFKSLTGSLPNLDRGLFYVNVEGLLETVRSTPTVSSSLAASPEVDSVLRSIQGLAVTGDQPNENTAIGEALLTFQQE